jgi:hypothetical protein
MREVFEMLSGRSVAVWHEGGTQVTGTVKAVGAKYVVIGEWSGDAAMHLMIPFERIQCIRYSAQDGEVTMVEPAAEQPRKKRKR